MVRLADFDDTVNNGQAGFSAFLKQNKRVFARAYQRKAVGISDEEAQAKIKEIKNEGIRSLALGILYSGMRASEALTRRPGSNTVTGKGGRDRVIFLPDGHQDGSRSKETYSMLYRELKRVGLKPHDLRKLAATRLVRAGMREHDLLKVMGWTSMQTAAIYLQPMDNEALANKVKEAFENARS